MELIYTNQNGASIMLRQVKPLFLRRLDGTGQVRQTIYTFHAPEQDGAFYISSTVDMRNITIEGTIVANSVDESYLYRQRILKAFTPKQSGTLIYRQRQITCIVEDVSFSVSNTARAPAFFVSLLCPSPFFETLNDIRTELVSWQEAFSFPLEIVPPGIEMGIRQPSQIITIENIGDVSCGCEIVFRALGSVSNPELMNVDTGEYLRIMEDMQSGEELRVYTQFAGKRITKVIGTTETNAFSELDIGSTFLQLAPGTNNLRYDVDGNLDLLDVTIFYRPQFLGI